MLRLLRPTSSLSQFLALAGIGDLRPRFEAQGFFTLECLLEADVLALLQNRSAERFVPPAPAAAPPDSPPRD